MISYVLPTRDRPERLKSTLQAIERLGGHAECGGAEVVIVDNDSRERLVPPARLRGGVGVRQVCLSENLGAAARNVGVRESDPSSGWIVMLDDDSYPLDLGFAAALREAPPQVAAVSADIFLPGSPLTGPRESGGLPEVFIGCGVAIRRDVFLRLGGYDASFGYYAEEYDLAARILLSGGRVAFDPRFRVLHAKVAAHRNMNLILSRLVRNNGWVAQRYAPDDFRLAEIRETRRRYRRIATKENALAGFAEGLVALRRTIGMQARTPMPVSMWDRFTGLAYARAALRAALAHRPFATAAVVDAGKNGWVIAKALAELNVRLTGEGEDAQAVVIGTMSPGPMLDAWERRSRWQGPHTARVIAPWESVGTAERRQAAGAIAA